MKPNEMADAFVKCAEVVSDKHKVKPIQLHPDMMADWRSRTVQDEASHILWMCEQGLKFLVLDQIHKANRWLGFVQGWMWSERMVSINEMREWNRTNPKVEPTSSSGGVAPNPYEESVSGSGLAPDSYVETETSGSGGMTKVSDEVPEEVPPKSFTFTLEVTQDQLHAEPSVRVNINDMCIGLLREISVVVKTDQRPIVMLKHVRLQAVDQSPLTKQITNTVNSNKDNWQAECSWIPKWLQVT